MRFFWPRNVFIVALALLTLCLGARAQSPSAQSNRIPPQPDLTHLTQLSGHLPAWVNLTTDIGPVQDDMPIRLTLLLNRSPTLQTAFEQLLRDQQNPSSPRYQQWLTPAQIGEQFGPTQDDVSAIIEWLTTSGLHRAEVSPSRTFLTVTGTTGAAASTFAVAFHQFTYNGQPHLSAISEPTVPTSLTSVLGAIDGLTDLPLQPFHTVGRAAVPIAPNGNSTTGLHYLFPGDFARIYDVATSINSGYDGTGSRVAIVGLSRITTSDVTELQAIAGLPQKAPNTIIIPTSADPGIVPVTATNGNQSEALLDVVRVLTTAPGSQADLVLATNAAGGIGAAMQYNVNTLVDPIMTISFGACESAAGASAVTFYDTLFAQGAAEGISTFISSGDAAAAGCSPNFSTPTGQETLAMGNFLCASSYATCVGGTEFADAGKDSIYWSTSNSSTYVSAFGYIPEGAWNEPTTTNANGVTTFQIAGSGSGPSAFIPKPFWQTGTGVPTDGARDIPDISFSSAQHDGYFTCYAAAGGDCNAGSGIIFSGTSAAAPSMAGITAILRQRLNNTAQGNLNPLLYRLAASSPAAFHDATPASSAVSACTITTATLCNNSVPSPTSISGGLAGYALQVGYDLVTGLGSLDVGAFLNAAVSVPTKNTTQIGLIASPSTFTTAQTTTLTATVNGLTPTGTVQFYSNGNLLGPSISLMNGSAVSPPTSFPAAGAYSLTAIYSGDSLNSTSTSSAYPITVTLPPTPGITASVTSSSLSVSAGATTGNNTAYSLNSVNGFAGSVGLTCSIVYAGGTATFPPTCSIAASSLTLTANSNQTTQVTIGTTIPHTTPSAAAQAVNLIFGRKGFAPFTLAVLLAVFPARRRRLFRRLPMTRTQWMIPFLLAGSLLSLSGCGKSTGSSTTAPSPTLIGTSKGTYTVTITATPASGSATAVSTTIALTVN